MSEPDLDDSWVVEGVTWALYLGWLCALAGLALWIGIEPLPTIQARFPGWPGTAAALATGAGFLLVSRYAFDALRGKKAAPPSSGAPSPPPPETRKRKRKKKR